MGLAPIISATFQFQFMAFAIKAIDGRDPSQGSRESLRGPGQIYVVTALIDHLTVLLEYIDIFGPIS